MWRLLDNNSAVDLALFIRIFQANYSGMIIEDLKHRVNVGDSFNLHYYDGETFELVIGMRWVPGKQRWGLMWQSLSIKKGVTSSSITKEEIARLTMPRLKEYIESFPDDDPRSIVKVATKIAKKGNRVPPLQECRKFREWVPLIAAEFGLSYEIEQESSGHIKEIFYQA